MIKMIVKSCFIIQITEFEDCDVKDTKRFENMILQKKIVSAPEITGSNNLTIN